MAHEELKAFIAEQLGTTARRIDEMDGKLAEAVESFGKKAALPEDVREQLTRLESQLQSEPTRPLAQGVGGAKVERKLRDAVATSPFVARWREGGSAALPPPGATGLVLPDLLSLERAHYGEIAKVRRQVEIGASSIASVPEYLAGITKYMRDPVALALRVPTTPLSSATAYWLSEHRQARGGGVVSTSDGAVVGGASNVITLIDVDGLMAGSKVLIRRTDGAGTFLGWEEKVVQSVNPATRVVTMTANIVGNVADGDLVSALPYSGTAPGAQKPYSWVGIESNSAVVETVALLVKIQKQTLDDTAGIEAFIKDVLTDHNVRNLNWHLLYGTAATGELNGFLANANRQTYAWSAGAIGDSLADAMVKGSTNILGSGQLEATMHKTAWTELISEKAVDGHYINGNTSPLLVVNRPGLKVVGDMVVALDDEITTTHCLIANHAAASKLGVREQNNFAWGYSSDDFEKNLLTGRLEGRFSHMIQSFQSYVHVTFDSRPV
jgi:hypothetical protein